MIGREVGSLRGASIELIDRYAPKVVSLVVRFIEDCMYRTKLDLSELRNKFSDRESYEDNGFRLFCQYFEDYF